MKKLIEKVKNIIFKKKIKKVPQRLKHKVQFSIEYNCEEKDAHKSKPIIAFVEAGGISEKKFFIGDVVKSINGIKVKTADNLDNEVNKLNSDHNPNQTNNQVNNQTNPQNTPRKRKKGKKG